LRAPSCISIAPPRRRKPKRSRSSTTPSPSAPLVEKLSATALAAALAGAIAACGLVVAGSSPWRTADAEAADQWPARRRSRATRSAAVRRSCISRVSA
jgi:hypothetical protein